MNDFVATAEANYWIKIRIPEIINFDKYEDKLAFEALILAKHHPVVFPLVKRTPHMIVNQVFEDFQIQISPNIDDANWFFKWNEIWTPSGGTMDLSKI